MIITRQDETELLTALHEGPMETPPWRTFLERLQRRTGADYAGMIFRRGEGQPRSTEIAVGRQVPEALQRRYVEEFHRYDPIPHYQLRPNRVYALDEFLDPANPDHKRYADDFMAPAMLAQSRTMRVREPGGYEVWIVIAREEGDFQASDSALLAALAPHLTIAIRVFATIEKERLRAGISGDAMRRLNFGWLTLDLGGHIVDLDAQAERLLQRSTALQRTASGKLRPSLKRAEKQLADVLRDAAAGHPLKSRAIHLSDEPWLDMLIAPMKETLTSAAKPPVLVAYIHGEEHSTAERQEQLMSLFGLSRNEARLALSLSRGRSIAQSAEDLGLTLETTRLYSKRIYAKTGTSGQADLVRLILASVVALV